MSLLICEDKDCRIVVDRKSRMIRFERCHSPRSWLWPKAAADEFVCALDDVIAVHQYRSDLDQKGITGTAVVTRHGRAMLSKSMKGTEGMVRFLKEECQGRGPGPWHQNPNMEMLMVLFLVLGAFGGFAIYIKWFWNS